MTAISLPMLVLGIGFQTLQTLLVALAWRNILRAAYPEATSPTARHGLLRRRQRAERDPAGIGRHGGDAGPFPDVDHGIDRGRRAGRHVVENIFFAIMGFIVYLWLFLGVAGSFDVKFGWFSDHWGSR